MPRYQVPFFEPNASWERWLPPRHQSQHGKENASEINDSLEQRVDVSRLSIAKAKQRDSNDVERSHNNP
jgi:hypothetical protein